MMYFKKVGTKYVELIRNVNIINNQVYYDNYKGYRFVTDVTSVVTEKDIDKQVRYNLFILKNNS